MRDRRSDVPPRHGAPRASAKLSVPRRRALARTVARILERTASVRRSGGGPERASRGRGVALSGIVLAGPEARR